MTRKTRTHGELKKASEHLFYEVWMFQSLANGMTSGVFGTGPVNNAVLEAFIVHARNLIYFLYAEKPKQDNVIANDFISNWENLRPPKSQYLNKVERRAHKEVAHLSYDRQKVTPETKPWEFNKVVQEIMDVFNLFYENVPKELLGDSWSRVQ